MFKSYSIHFFLHYLSYFLACVTAYRAVAFTHEIVHQKFNKNFDRKFIWFYNLTAGAIALCPSCGFNKHLKHHAIGIFGTENDSQYPLLRKDGKWQIDKALLLFILLPIINPWLNIARVIVTPIDFYFSHKNIKLPLLFLFDNNMKLSDMDRLMLFGLDIYYGICLGCLVWSGYFWQWYAIAVGGYFLGFLRIPLEHKLEEYKEKTNLEDQEIDSFDFQRTWKKPFRSLYSFIVQPIGLNWHRRHHKYPSKYYWELKELID